MGSTSTVLIDSGTGRGSEIVIQNITAALNGRKLTSIILTHCHADHIGGASVISKHFDCPVYIGKNDAAVLREADSWTAFAGPLGVNLEPVECNELQDGDIIDLGDYRLRVIDTPGHTAGGICLYDEFSSSLFSGDTLFEQGIGRTDLPGGSIDKLCESLVRLHKVNIKVLYPGHGPACKDGAGSLEYALHMVGIL